MPSNDPLATFEGCPIVMADGKPCGRPLHQDQSELDNRPVCVMHSRDTKKRGGDFGENMNAILQCCSTANRISSRFDFTGFVFPHFEFRQNYDRVVIFKNAIFILLADFSGSSFATEVDFSDATFMLGARFNKVTFKSNSKFSQATFRGDVDFTQSTFQGAVDFSGASFGQLANFSGINFQVPVDFSRVIAAHEVKFSGTSFQSTSNFTLARLTQADFSKTTFHNEATFLETTHLKHSNFSNAMFIGIARFSRNTFENSVDFVAASFVMDAIFLDTTFTAGANFKGAVFSRGADFSYAVLGPRGGGPTLLPAIADFRDVRFNDPNRALFHHINKNSSQGLKIRLVLSNVEGVRFADIHWYGEGDRKMVLQDELDITMSLKIEEGTSVSSEESMKEIPKSPPPSYEQIAITYRQLINNFEKVRAFDLTEDCWYGVREMKRLNPYYFVMSRQLLPYYKRCHWLRWLGERLSFLYLYKKISGYGCSHQRAFMVLFVVIFVFAVVYPVIGLDEISDSRRAAHVGLSSIPEMTRAYGAGWLHSLEVATFQRSPVYVPSNHLGRLAEIVETIMVPIQASLLLLARRRRFRTGSSAASA